MAKQYEIGGFPSFESYEGQEYHENASRFNTARAAMEYIFSHRRVKRVWIPNWSCDSMLEPMKKLELPYEYYDVDCNLEPRISPNIVGQDTILIINYYCLLSGKISEIAKKYQNPIIDHTQAFFSKIEKGDTIYSPRKFFGVPDGGYLYTDLVEPVDKKDISYNRIYCAKRYELGANEAYPDFLANEKELEFQPIRQMSSYTRNILKSLDYQKIRRQRMDNFLFLHQQLGKRNTLEVERFNGAETSFMYPFYSEEEGLREALIDKGIYIPTYWKETLSRVKEESLEAKYTKYILPLPIDQRYQPSHMQSIVDEILSYLS